MALVEVRILLCEHFQSELLETFFFSAGSVKNTSFLDPDQLFTLEATKDSNTCVCGGDYLLDRELSAFLYNFLQ